jgi:hypothetical protein
MITRINVGNKRSMALELDDDVHWHEGFVSAMYVGTLSICTMFSPLSMLEKVQKRVQSRDPRNHAVDHP